MCRPMVRTRHHTPLPVSETYRIASATSPKMDLAKSPHIYRLRRICSAIVAHTEPQSTQRINPEMLTKAHHSLAQRVATLCPPCLCVKKNSM